MQFNGCGKTTREQECAIDPLRITPRAYLAALPTNPPEYANEEFDPGMVGKGVLVCCMTSFRKWSVPGVFALDLLHIAPQRLFLAALLTIPPACSRRV